MKIQTLIQSMALLAVVLTTGCTTPGKGVLPQDKGATMVDVYNQETSTHDASDDGYYEGNYEPDSPAYETEGGDELANGEPSQVNTETAANPYTKVAIRKVVHVSEVVSDAGDYYKPVDNIRMKIYVFPHRIYNEDGEESIVPAYYTYYPLYSHQHYYLPNEAF